MHGTAKTVVAASKSPKNVDAPAAQLLYNAIVRDGLADHQKIRGFRIASSYGRGSGQSTNGGSAKKRVEPRTPVL